MSEPLAVVCWRWGTLFGPEYVNRLASMFRRHLHMPYTFHCIATGDLAPTEYDPEVALHPMYLDHAEMTAGSRSCFRRLRLLDAGMRDVFGPRILQVDLDTVIVDDVTPLFDRPEPLVLCRQQAVHDRVTYNPSMMLMDAGVLHRAWEEFHAAPASIWSTARARGWSCSDMAVINNYVEQARVRPAFWTEEEGVVAYWREVRRAKGALPPGARVVLFYGTANPSDADLREKSPWIEEHWR